MFFYNGNRSLRQASTVVLLSTAFYSCHLKMNPSSREFEQTSNPASGTLASLIFQNTAESRSTIAGQISEYLKEFPSDEPSHTLNLLLQNTRNALLNGPHSLCNSDERLTFYRGVGTVFKTADGKSFSASSGTYESQSVSSLFKAYAAKSTLANDTFPAVSPYSYDELGSQHTVEQKSSKSAFISIAALPAVAGGFGRSILKLSMCPTRALSTPNQAWAESEFLPALIIFPEEIVGEMTPQQAFVAEIPILGKCYGPESGGGDVSHGKKISAENFSLYNEIILKKSSHGPDISWKEDFGKFLKEQCDCPKMIARKNQMYKKIHPDLEGPYTAELECS